MKAQSTTSPSIYSFAINEQDAKIWLRENITELVRNTDEATEVYYEYDEYSLTIRNRENIEEYVQNNFGALIEKAKNEIGLELFTKLNKEVNQYLYEHYDAGTQSSLLSLHVDPSTPQSAKDAIESVWNWIKSVMGYYYTIKNLLLSGAVIKWDFSQFDASDPRVKLSDFMGQ